MNDLLISPSIRDRLGVDDAPVSRSKKDVGGMLCRLSSPDTVLEGRLMSYTDIDGGQKGFSVTLVVGTDRMREALGIIGISSLDISIDGSSMISRAIPSDWIMTREVNPGDPGLGTVVVFSAMPADR